MRVRNKLDDRILEMMTIEEFKKAENCYGPLDLDTDNTVLNIKEDESQLKILQTEM